MSDDDWSHKYMNAFPPFSLISQMMQKLEREDAELMLIVPICTTRSWFPQIMRRLINDPVIL